MADVFISFSRLDEDRVRPIAERLASLGHSVWRREEPRQNSEAELEAATAVLVVWSRNGRNSVRVCAEAAHAAERGALLQMRLDPTNLPAPFDALPAPDMSGERGEWGPLEHALAERLRGHTAMEAVNFPRRALAAPIAGSPGLTLVALAAALATLAGALGPAADGVLTPDQLWIAVLGVLGVASACTMLSVWRFFTAARAGLS